MLWVLHQMVSIWRIIKVSDTNKKTPGPDHSTFSRWWIVECFIEPGSWCNLVVHIWSTISIFPLGKTNKVKVLHDLRISESSLNQITSRMVIIFLFVALNCGDHKCYSEYLYSAFKDPDQYYDLWVYGFVWMHVYFQVGMIIGDTEQHNKQYMWLLWRKRLT